MVVLSSVTASVIGRSILGNDPFLALPSLQVEHVVQYPLFALLGLVAGLVGVAFSRVLYAIEDACDWAWRGPEWLRPAVGGILLGGLLLVLPEMYGVGYPVLGKAVAGGYGIAFLIALLVGKLVACSLTIGIGGSGGVFAPSLFCGAMTGAVFGDVVHAVLPGTGGTTAAYALVGMGAVFAGAARAPITAVVILFELTGEYSIILPLMLAIVLATGISHLVSHDTVYTRKLLRRGIDIDEPADASLRRRLVSSVMADPPAPVGVDASLRSVAARFASNGTGSLPVVDGSGRFLGTISAHDLMDALASGEDATVGALVAATVPLGPGASIGDAWRQLDGGADAVPVQADNGDIIGWISHREMLAALGPSDLRPELRGPRAMTSPAGTI